MFSALSQTSRTEPVGKNSSSTSRKAGFSDSSVSIAVTFAPAFASSSVSVPRPGPISITRSPGSTPARRTMSWVTDGSMRMCCPRDFLRRMPCLAASSSQAAVDVKAASRLGGGYRFGFSGRCLAPHTGQGCLPRSSQSFWARKSCSRWDASEGSTPTRRGACLPATSSHVLILN